MAILGFPSESHRIALALFGAAIGAAAELAVPSPAPQVRSQLAVLQLQVERALM